MEETTESRSQDSFPMTTPIVVSGLVPSGGGGVAVAVLNASLDVLKYAAISAAPPPSPIAPAQCAMVRAAANAVVLFDNFLSFLVSRRFLSGNGVTPSVGKIKSRCPEKNTNPRRRYVASTQEARFRARNRNLFTVLPCIQYFNYSGKFLFAFVHNLQKVLPLSHTLLHNKHSHLHMFKSLKRSLSLKAYSKL